MVIDFLIILIVILVLFCIQFITHKSYSYAKKHPKLYNIIEWADGLYWDITIFITPLLIQPRIQDINIRILLTVIGLIIGGFGLYLMVEFVITNKNIGKTEMEDLYTDGVYGFVRHPGYLGIIFMFIGWSFIWKAVYCIILSPLILLHVIWVSKFEEKIILSPQFGEEYGIYKKNTPAFFRLSIIITFIGLISLVMILFLLGKFPIT